MKKLVCILGLIAIISCSVCFATEFNDTKSTKFEDAVNVLTKLSIVNGYEDGTFRPNNEVTRAEMAKLIIVMTGRDSVASSLKGKTQFPDVVEGGWASGYINCAVAQNIIKGYPDGTFKPNNQVTYAEAATMVLRALNYTKELETETYPTGYMTVANNAGILKNVQATKSSDNATRGYIANMLFNALKTGTRKIVSTTTTGKVNYGDGLPLVEQSFSNIKCIKDGLVVEVDFDEREIVVSDKPNDRKITLDIDEEDELRKLYMRKVDIIYNSDSKEYISFEIVDNYTIKEIEIDKIKNDTIYDKNENEYDLPEDDDDVLFQYITNYDEAETAYITYNDSKKMVCVVLEGTPKINGGLVADSSITVSKSKGIEVLEPDDDYHEYAYSDRGSQKTKNGEFILFSLDNDDEIVVRDRVIDEDAGPIKELDEDYIKVKFDKKEVELPKSVEYYVYLVTTGKSVKEASLSDVEKEFDTAYITSIAEIYYIVVFEDSVDPDDIVSTLSVSEAKELLEDTLDAAKKKMKKEEDYSVATFEPFSKAYEAALDAYDGSSSAAKLEILNRKLQQTMDDLKSATKEDDELRDSYETLKSLIKTAESKKSADYTAASFKTLTTELKNAKAIKLDNTTVSKVESRITSLRKAINMLVTVAANNEIQSLTSKLKSLISTAENRIKNKADYTDASISALNTALTNAKKLNTSSATLAELKTQVSNLEAAIDSLVSKSIGNYETAREKLKTNYDSIMSITNSSGTYSKDSYEAFVAQREEINTAYNALPKVSDVSSMTASQISSETTKVNNLIDKITKAKGLLVSAKVQTAKDSLQTLVNTAKEIGSSDWTNVNGVSYSALQTKITNYQKLINNSSATLDQLNDAISDLSVLIALNK